MHPQIERLAELADSASGDPDPELRDHAAACTSCQAQVSQLHMLAAAGGSHSVEPLPERGGHITDEEIIGYANSSLSAEKHAHIKRHLHACTRCMKEVLLYRSHVAQIRLLQTAPAAVAGAAGTRSWLTRLGTWVRGLFHFSMPVAVWIGMAGTAAGVAVLVSPLWFSETSAPITTVAQTSKNASVVPLSVAGNEPAAASIAPEESVASTQVRDDTSPRAPVAVRHPEQAPRSSDAPPVVTTAPLDQFRGASAVAVVIGNKSYAPGTVLDAKYALQDAQRVKTWLVSALGVAESNIIYIENATSAQFNEVFGSSDNPAGKLAAAVQAGVSDVFIYYSGHGAPDIGSKRAYFVPADADPGFIALSGYAVDTLFNNLAQLSAHSVTVVLDTNFSGNSAGGTLLKNVSPALVKTEQYFPKLANVTIFSGASQGQVNAWHDGQSHSLFTYLFLKGVEGSADGNRDGSISALELQKYLQQAVPYEARRLGDTEQTPVLTQIQDRVLVNVR